MRGSYHPRLLIAALAAVFAFSALPAQAALATRSSPGPLPFGGFTSPTVEWIRNIPLEGEVDGVTHVLYRVGDYLYHDGSQRFSILDISDPLHPKLVSQIERPGPGPWPSSIGYYNHVGRSVTNGDIVVMPGGHPDYFIRDPRALYVFDITDKENPRRIGELILDETFGGYFCVLDCNWVYDRYGHVIDLRDPRRPRLTHANWMDALRTNSSATGVFSTETDEIREVAPGLLLTASVPMYLLDARKDPLHPRIVARSDGTPLSYGDVSWPGFGTGEIVLSSDPQTNVPMCDSERSTGGTHLDHGFVTWDASRWKTLGIMTPLDVYTPRNGTYVDGDPPASVDAEVGACSVNRFHPHPRFGKGGLVAAGAMAHGLKILRVDNAGQIHVAGWFLPYGYGDAGAAMFISDRIVYVVDRWRGIDIVRYKGKL